MAEVLYKEGGLSPPGKSNLHLEWGHVGAYPHTFAISAVYSAITKPLQMNIFTPGRGWRLA